MRCVACRRTLLLPPAVVVGGYAYGPKCAQRAGLVRIKERNHPSEAVRDAKTRDWVQEVASHPLATSTTCTNERASYALRFCCSSG